MRDELGGGELQWLRQIRDPLNLSDPALDVAFDPAALRVARAAYQVLTV